MRTEGFSSSDPSVPAPTASKATKLRMGCFLGIALIPVCALAQTATARGTLGSILLQQNSYAAAEPLLLCGYQGPQQRKGKLAPIDNAILAETLEALIQLYQTTGRPGQAATCKQTLSELNPADKAVLSHRPSKPGA